MDGTITEYKPDLGFNGGHIAIILGVAVLLVGITFLRNPQSFSLSSLRATAAQQADVPHYYAYVAPPEPQVAGASTETPQSAVSVINEDGSVTPLSVGQVLGVNSADVQQNMDSIKIAKIIPNSADAVRGYLSYTTDLERKYLNGAALETALTSKNPTLIQSTVNKLEALIGDLGKMYMPTDVVTLHKLTVVQYSAAVELLKNFSQLDSNPDLATSKLGIFMEAQSQQSQEMQSVLQKNKILTDGGLGNGN